MITDADVKKLKTIFATKKDLEGLRVDLKGTENYLNYKIDSLDKKVDKFKEEFTGFKDSVLKSLDWLVGAFTKFEEEHTILTEQNGRANGKLDNHEARIEHLEYANKQ
ncbi:MAG: hypothetical protein WC894_01700 [Patescibacteria group bacterium]